MLMKTDLRTFGEETVRVSHLLEVAVLIALCRCVCVQMYACDLFNCCISETMIIRPHCILQSVPLSLSCNMQNFLLHYYQESTKYSQKYF